MRFLVELSPHVVGIILGLVTLHVLAGHQAATVDFKRVVQDVFFYLQKDRGSKTLITIRDIHLETGTDDQEDITLEIFLPRARVTMFVPAALFLSFCSCFVFSKSDMLISSSFSSSSEESCTLRQREDLHQIMEEQVKKQS